MRTRGVFDKETRRKPLAFAADAVRYGLPVIIRPGPEPRVPVPTVNA
jgi:hypothetical protein